MELLRQAKIYENCIIKGNRRVSQINKYATHITREIQNCLSEKKDFSVIKIYFLNIKVFNQFKNFLKKRSITKSPKQSDSWKN